MKLKIDNYKKYKIIIKNIYYINMLNHWISKFKNKNSIPETKKQIQMNQSNSTRILTN